VVAKYLIESYHSLERASEVLAGEQSSGTFTAVPRETEALKHRHGARVLEIEPLATRAEPSLPGATCPDGASAVNAGVATISFPLENFGPSLPNLMAAVLGNLFELRELAGIRLLDLQLPDAFADRYPGPAFGISGSRQLMNVTDDPMVGTIVKPSVGLRSDEFREVVRELVDADIDFIKDDELLGNPPYLPLHERVRVAMEEIDRGAQRTGRKVMYAFNITDDLDPMLAHYDAVAAHGGTCVMVCVNLVGFAGLSYLRERCALPIHGHRAMIGALMRHPGLGIDFCAYQKLARLAGVDHLHTNGMDNKFYESNEEVLASVRAVLRPLLGGYETLPVLSSGQWAGTAATTFRLIGTTDVLMLAGGGIHAHPGGPAAGVASIRQGWQAAVSGVPLERYAETHEALRQAVLKFGMR
jgi:ribulose-bisphosphate carboxylase large chain